MDPVCHLLVITICSQDRIRTCMVPFTWLPLSKKVRVVARMRYRSAHLTIFARTFRAVKIFSVFQPKRLLNPFSSLYVVDMLKFSIPTRFEARTGFEPVWVSLLRSRTYSKACFLCVYLFRHLTILRERTPLCCNAKVANICKHTLLDSFLKGTTHFEGENPSVL